LDATATTFIFAALPQMLEMRSLIKRTHTSDGCGSNTLSKQHPEWRINELIQKVVQSFVRIKKGMI